MNMNLDQNVVQNEEEDSQASYQPTQYQDCSWELVGEYLNQETFEPLGFQVINTATVRTDRMFADYGGIEDANAAERYHGSRGRNYKPLKNSLEAIEEEREETLRALEQLKADHVNEIQLAKQVAFASSIPP